MTDRSSSGARTGVRLDHILFAVEDFARATETLYREHGLAAVEGGRHSGWGTANWIVPLGAAYLELVSIVDPGLAATTAFGQRAGRALAHGGGPYAWCVSTDRVDAVAARLGLEVGEGSRRRPDGSELAWRSAGLEVALADPSRPFWLEWKVPPELYPGREPVPHRVKPRGIAWVEVGGDERTIGDWLGDASLPVHVRPGPPAVLGVGIATDDGEVVIRG